jgi:hypothetical protein
MRRRHLPRTLASAAFLGALTAACSGNRTSDTGPPDASSPIHIDNASFNAVSTVASVEPAFSAYEGDAGLPVGYGQALTVLLTNRSEVTCANVPPLFPIAGAAQVQLIVTNPPGVLTPGTYPVSVPLYSARASGAGYTVLPTDCSGAGIEVIATSGSVTLTAVTSTRITGTYDVTLGPPLGADGGSTGSLSGSFDVPPCGSSNTDGGAGSVPVCTFRREQWKS